jgi:hypothetical protein
MTGCCCSRISGARDVLCRKGNYGLEFTSDLITETGVNLSFEHSLLLAKLIFLNA